MNIRQKRVELVLICLFIHIIPAKAVEQIYIPEILKPWQNWVLHDKQEYMCPIEFNNNQKCHCDWISYLDLDLKKNNSLFSMKGILFKDQYVLLPGQNDCWPDCVSQNNNFISVLSYKNKPAVILPKGSYEISGQFLYDRLPKSIFIPPHVGLLTLKINGKKIQDHFFSKEQRLWLRTGHAKMPLDNRMHLQIYRLITDNIPMTMTLYLQLSVSGNSREEQLNDVFPDKSIVMSIDSPLPIQLEDNANLRLHVRTGKWRIKIVSRLTSPVHHMIPNFLIQENEIWSFKSQPHLRMIKLVGLQGLDPVSSGVPQEWHSYPAYRIHKNSVVDFQEQQRGDPDASPDQLHLHRHLWLDFSGNGYTIHDKINGIINQNWRLNMNAPIQLGRVSFSDKDQLLTQYNNQPGIEIRTGQLKMTADARYTESISFLPAIGWDQSMNQVHESINLPPGWRLLTVFGTDTVLGSWLSKWRLLDLFLALLIGMAIYHLKNIQWAVLAWITMILTFHEPSAPQLTWLHLLAVIALLNVVPQGRFYVVMRLWFIIAMVLICIYALPFMMYQIQSGLFPQLESYHLSHSQIRQSVSLSQSMPKRINLDKSVKTETTPRSIAYDKTRQHVSEAIIQTGPGLPQWKWKTVQLKWNGPVDKSQYFRLILVSPSMNATLAIIRVIFVLLLLFGIGKRFVVHLYHERMCKLGESVCLEQKPKTSQCPKPM
jgi:hypothetical protein